MKGTRKHRFDQEGFERTSQTSLSDYLTDEPETIPESTVKAAEIKLEFIQDETCAGENETKSAKVKEPLVNLDSEAHKE